MMKKITNYLFSLLLTGAFIFLTSCSEDDPAPKGPTVTPPQSIAVVKVNEMTEISFIVEIPGGYKLGGTGVIGTGNAIIKTDLAVGAVAGTIVVEYQAGSTAGTEAVVLTVSDNSDQLAANTAAVNVSEDDPPPANEVLSGVIEADLTLTADRIWELAGRVIVDATKTLTIEPGTIIKGRPGTGTNASALIVSRGSKIMAEGTADKPIIFTATVDNIQVGQKMGTNLEKEDNEKWGGLIVLGAAPISAGDGDTESSIEGLPAEEPFAKYGGDLVQDNSGVIKYVSIRHGGISIGAGNEINGLTLGGVGNGTMIDFVEIYATLDDGIEFFGGTVNVSNAVVAWQGDDGVDIDQNYAGTVNNFVITHGAGVGTDEGLEIDGPEGTTFTTGLFTLSKGSIINDGNEGTPGDFKSKSQGTTKNVKFEGYAAGSETIKVRASYSNACLDSKTDSWTYLTSPNSEHALYFEALNYTKGVAVYTASVDNDTDKNACTISEADKTSALIKMPDSIASEDGADKTVFDWTAAKMDGLF